MLAQPFLKSSPASKVQLTPAARACGESGTSGKIGKIETVFPQLSKRTFCSRYLGREEGQDNAKDVRQTETVSKTRYGRSAQAGLVDMPLFSLCFSNPSSIDVGPFPSSHSRS